MSRRRVRVVVALASVAWLALASPDARATPENDLDPENLISDSLPSRAPASESEGRSLPFAIFPQAGYGPETGPKVGVKFEGRDLFGGSTVGRRESARGTRAPAKGHRQRRQPELGPFMLFGTAAWYTDPSVEFFGLGNNDIGPDPLSNHGCGASASA
jgi:hypothetical protein